LAEELPRQQLKSGERREEGELRKYDSRREVAQPERMERAQQQRIERKERGIALPARFEEVPVRRDGSVPPSIPGAEYAEHVRALVVPDQAAWPEDVHQRRSTEH